MQLVNTAIRCTHAGPAQRPALARLVREAARQLAPDAPPAESMLVRTKVRIPTACGDVIDRERLLRLGEQVRQRLLSLVVAPPGCGKTTLAAQWSRAVAAQGGRIGWFSIDADDNSPLRFLLYLREAIVEAGLGKRASGEPALSAGPWHEPSALSSALINWIAEGEDDLLVVLDNYAWVTDGEVHRQVSFLLDNAPANLHLVILTSNPPPLPVGALRARNQLLELNIDTIRFTRSETLDLLQTVIKGPIPYAQLRELHRLTHGWAAAVRIASLAMKDADAPLSPQRGTVDGAMLDAIDQYLDELFAGFPADLVQMMVDSSIVDALSLPLWEALTRGEDTETFFHQITQQQILIPLDREHGLYGYPGLVRRHLHRMLAAKGSWHATLLHRRAYAWYAGEKDWASAIDHALAAGDAELALQWMASNAMLTLTAGNVGTLLKWHEKVATLALVPAQRVRLAFAWAHAISRSLDAALEIVSVVESAGGGEPLPASLAAEGHVIRAMAYALADRLGEASAHLARCERGALSEDWMGAVVACIELHHRFCAGQWAAFYSEASFIASRFKGEVEAQMFRLSLLGLAALLRGHTECAARYCDDALRILPAADARDAFHFSAWPAGVLASIYHVQGRSDEVDRLLVDRLDGIAASGSLDCMLGAFTAAARARARKGRLTEALAILEQAEAIAVENEWLRMEAAVLLERTRIYVAEHRFDEAEGCVRRLSLLADGEEIEPMAALCTAGRFAELAKAHLVVRCGRAAEAVAPLTHLQQDFLKEGNELFGVAVGTLLSIALLRAGMAGEAADTFRAVLERAARCGFVNPVADQGAEVAVLLAGFLDSLSAGEECESLRDHAQRILRQLEPPRHEHPSAAAEVSEKAPAVTCALTPKEQEVLTLIARGQSNKEVARSLKVAPETIKTHLKHIFAKLEVERRIQAISKAQSLGLLGRAFE